MLWVEFTACLAARGGSRVYDASRVFTSEPSASSVVPCSDTVTSSGEQRVKITNNQKQVLIPSQDGQVHDDAHVSSAGEAATGVQTRVTFSSPTSTCHTKGNNDDVNMSTFHQFD